MKLPAVRIAILVALGCGCGLTVAGSLVSDVDGGAVTDAGPETGAALPESGTTDATTDTSVDLGAVDAGLDVNPANCAAACDGGTCDGGWCTFACGAGQCQNSPVVCPPGIPCAVACTADNSCNAGVDCRAASACDIACTAQGACTNGPVRCTGASCAVKCSGSNACNLGVQCDAGTCALDCTGQGACANSTIDCHATTCSVVCGDGAGGGSNACNLGVSCIAAQSCDIVCQDQGTCANKRIVAIAGSRADVRCTGSNACNSGVLTSAADGGVLCANDACGPGIFCDGGACHARCDGTNTDVCCKAGFCGKQASNGCTLTDSCP